MRIKCEDCCDAFIFWIHGETWSGSEEYKTFETNCPHCSTPAIIKYFMREGVVKAVAKSKLE